MVTDALLGVLLDEVIVVGVLLPSLVIVIVVVAVVLLELMFSSWLCADFNKESTAGCCCCPLEDEVGVGCAAGVFWGVIGQLLEPVQQRNKSIKVPSSSQK